MQRMLMVFAAAALSAGLVGCGPEYPNCGNDDDCRESEFCVDGHCQQCRDNSDCEDGFACDEGRCDPIEGYCQDDSVCPDGQNCRNNRCVDAPAPVTQAPSTAPPAEPSCRLQVVSFDFDSDELAASARDQIERNAACIQERAITDVHLAGHCDPRGTEEYNLALGDRRARTVQRYLQSLGVETTVTVSSMGEEMASGMEESGWGRDRRVVFVER